MADLAASAVTVERAWCEGGVTGKELSCRQVTMVLTAQGTTTNKIPASVLQLTKIEQASNLVKSDNTIIIVATPSYDGSVLLLRSLAGAETGAPADYTGTVRGVVKGYL